MAERITNDQLNALLRIINDEIGVKDPSTRKVGSYLFDQAYGGIQLVRISSAGGGERDISPRLSKRELYTWMHAFIDGIEAGKSTKRRR